MNLAKFERLIESRGLWFAAANSFKDVLEGTKSVRESQSREAMWDEVGVPEKNRETIWDLTHWHRKSSYVNCWMMNANESVGKRPLHGEFALVLHLRLCQDDLVQQPSH